MKKTPEEDEEEMHMIHLTILPSCFLGCGNLAGGVVM